MKKGRFTQNHIIFILKEADSGIPIAELNWIYRLAKSAIYTWRSKYGGMEVSDLKELMRLKDENRRIKDLYAKISLEHTIL